MASSSFLSANFTNLLDIKACKRYQCGTSRHEVGRSLPKNGGSLQYLRTSFKTAPINKRSKKDFAIYSSPPGTEEVEIVAETVEKVADTAEDVAEDVEKLAEDVAENLPDGSKLKNVVSFVENAAKETAKDAQLAEDLLDKVEEVDQQVESIITHGSKATVKVAANDQN